MNPRFQGAVVIGAGPVGLFGVFALGMANIPCQVIDALPAPGGQCAALYPEKPIYDIPAQPFILGAELIERLTEQARPFNPIYHLNQQANLLTRLADGFWRVETKQGLVLEAPVVFIATGAGAFGPKRPPLDGLEGYEGTSVHYFVRRALDFKDRRVAIAGGGDSAVDWAILLSELADKVWLIHRRPQFRAQPGSLEKLMALVQAGKIDLVAPGQLSALKGDGKRLSAVLVDDLAGNLRELDADALLCFFGLLGDQSAMSGFGLDLEGGRLAVDPATMSTKLPGVFAIGDIATYPGKLKLILSGFAEAAQAAHAAFPFVHAGQVLHEVHSTTRGVPGTTSS
ncbi:MAG: NAD(P)/FAD-dependent oxidoreductase [Alphaproteobacteria bacterium]|nr:NAD(P)/FAD-dependent oxidoreductase [Alphaproteobacteria bacterium]